MPIDWKLPSSRLTSSHGFLAELHEIHLSMAKVSDSVGLLWWVKSTSLSQKHVCKSGIQLLKTFKVVFLMSSISFVVKYILFFPGVLPIKCEMKGRFNKRLPVMIFVVPGHNKTVCACHQVEAMLVLVLVFTCHRSK